MGRIHAIKGDGTILRDVAVFREAYRLIGLSWIYAPTRWPLIGRLADWTYRAWASWRLQVTGRESLEVLCANRCQPLGDDQAG
jgi:predicted DCC family thiol-disulfide oxidoreductase YuxK